jgi:hypothetical protein
VDRARARAGLDALLRPDNRVVLTYVPAEAPPDELERRHPAVEEASA